MADKTPFKYKVRRGGVLAAGAGVGAGLGKAYADAKGLPMDGDFWTRTVPDAVMLGAGMGTTIVGLGMTKIHSAASKVQFRK